MLVGVLIVYWHFHGDPFWQPQEVQSITLTQPLAGFASMWRIGTYLRLMVCGNLSSPILREGKRTDNLELVI
jgi:hypothetical protein